MNHLGTILTVSLTLYALGMCIFLISENRRPQATLAWMLVLLFAPGIGLLVYLFFGRDWKAFSKQRLRLEHDDGIYSPSGRLLRSGRESDAHYVSTEFSLNATWQIAPNMSLTGIYSHSFPGAFAKQTGPAKDIDFLEITLTTQL